MYMLFLWACSSSEVEKESLPGSDFSDGDGDGFAAEVDCNDNDAGIHPDASDDAEDGVDQDCDNTDGSTQGNFVDEDGDGYSATVDCDDGDALIHPGASDDAEDGVDQDCDGVDGLSEGTGFVDGDGDGYGSTVDCDDTDSSIYPGATEVAEDGIDQDCDGVDVGGSVPGVATLSVGELLISEIMSNPLAITDEFGEWIELYNNSGERIDLVGLVVTAAGTGLSFSIVGSLEVGAGDYVVLVREGDTTINGGVNWDYDYRGDFTLDNSFETLTLSYGNVTFDAVTYDDSLFFPDTPGASQSLDEDYFSASGNDSGQVWCDGTGVYGAGDKGSPGAANNACADLMDGDSDGYVKAHDCDDASGSIHPGANESAKDNVDSDCDGADYDATLASVGDLVISEIMYDPDVSADADGEWFEIYNSTGYTINLKGLIVSDDSTYVDQFTVDEDVLVASHGYAVLAVNSDSLVNGGVVADYDFPGSNVNFSNGGDDLYLLVGQNTVLDQVIWDGGPNFPDPTGASIELKSSKLSSSNNDTGSNWCEATDFIANDRNHDLGTPGTANGC